MRRATIPFALPPFQGWVRRLVLACTAVLLVQIVLGAYAKDFSVLFTKSLGLIPQYVLQGRVWQLVSYSFLHAGLAHLFGNMLILWMVGSLEEMEWGSRRFLELYFFSVIGGALATMAAAYLHILGNTPANVTIGASAAAMGLLMALAVLDGDRIFSILLFFVIPISLKVKYMVAIIVVGVLVATIQASDGVANVAHAGGLLAGFLWAKFIPRRGIGFEASETYFGIRNAWQRWKRRQAAKKFEVYMRKVEGGEVGGAKFDEHGNFIPPDEAPAGKKNGGSKSGWVN